MTRRLTVALLQLRAFDLAQHREAWDDLLRHIDEAAALDPHPDVIVLPEASYPAYFLQSREAYDAAGVLPDEQVLAILGERATHHQTAIAAGLVLHGQPGTAAEGRLENVGVLIGPDGAVRNRTPKAFLWHFDSEWFAPGVTHEVFDVAGTTAGILVCADARLPEISRSLAVGGAEVIIDCTAWVSSGRDPASLSTPQVDYLIPARAIENRTWVVAADKCGPEADTLVYAGRSGVCDPDGTWVAQAPADQPGVVHYTIDLDAPRRATVARRPELYARASVPGHVSRAWSLAREPIAAEGGAARIAAVALDASPSAVDLVERVRGLVRSLAQQGAKLIVLPDLSGSDPRGLSEAELLPLLQSLSREARVLVAALMAERTDGATYRTAYLLGTGEVLAKHRQTHLTAREEDLGFTPGDEPAPIVETAIGNIGLIAGAEGLVPEVGRGLKLSGAEALAWCAGDLGGVPLRTIARARANEERAYVVCAGDTSSAGGGYIVDPTGAVIGETLAGRTMAMSADMHRMLARWNDMAPGTNPVRDRDPAAFSILFT